MVLMTRLAYVSGKGCIYREPGGYQSSAPLYPNALAHLEIYMQQNNVYSCGSPYNSDKPFLIKNHRNYVITLPKQYNEMRKRPATNLARLVNSTTRLQLMLRT